MSNKADSLSQIGKRVKEIRKKQRLSLKELADKSGVSTGLISKIENFRTTPSLPVLYSIALALDTSLSDIVSMVANEEANAYILIKSNEREIEEREDSFGLIYESILSASIKNSTLKANLIRVNPGTNRPHISTEAIELLYMVSGTVQYGLDNELLDLSEGDALFFDGRIPHAVINKSESTAVMFKIYLFASTEE